MPKQELVISVFVASPSDVAEERDLLEQVIREINLTWANALGVRLDLVRWETHAFPAFGDDAQDVINSQIGQEYDIFIGIMWYRYGTPTGRSDSGTREEFDRAKVRYDDDKASVQLMMYFKDAPIAPSKIDSDQLKKIAQFKEVLQPTGLYFMFSTTEQFEELVRIHLSRQVQEIKNRISTLPNSAKKIPAPITTLPAVAPDDDGLLDLADTYESCFVELAVILGRITVAANDFSQKTSSRNRELNEFMTKPNNEWNRAAAKALLAKSAGDMTEYSKQLNLELPLYQKAFRTGIAALTKSGTMSVAIDMKGVGIQNRKNTSLSIEKLQAAMKGASTPLTEFRNVLAGFPNMTRELNLAKRKTVEALDEWLSEFAATETLLDEARAAFS